MKLPSNKVCKRIGCRYLRNKKSLCTDGCGCCYICNKLDTECIGTEFNLEEEKDFVFFVKKQIILDSMKK